MAAAADPASKLTPAQRKRLLEARPYVEVAPKVVRVATDAPVPDADHTLPTEPADPEWLEALADRWGLGGSLQRLLATLHG